MPKTEEITCRFAVLLPLFSQSNLQSVAHAILPQHRSYRSSGPHLHSKQDRHLVMNYKHQECVITYNNSPGRPRRLINEVLEDELVAMLNADNMSLSESILQMFRLGMVVLQIESISEYFPFVRTTAFWPQPRSASNIPSLRVGKISMSARKSVLTLEGKSCKNTACQVILNKGDRL